MLLGPTESFDLFIETTHRGKAAKKCKPMKNHSKF
jgi:hypothetical protein